MLGVTGLTGSGLTELAKAIFASPDIRREAGEIRLDGTRAGAAATRATRWPPASCC